MSDKDKREHDGHSAPPTQYIARWRVRPSYNPIPHLSQSPYEHDYD